MAWRRQAHQDSRGQGRGRHRRRHQHSPLFQRERKRPRHGQWARHEAGGQAVSTLFLEGGMGKSDADVPSRRSAPDHRAEWLRAGTTWGSAGASICTGVRAEPVAMRP
jgi:hypothetical protein